MGFGVGLPLLPIFARVIGGIFAFGLVGVWVRPMLLVAARTLPGSRVADGEARQD